MFDIILGAAGICIFACVFDIILGAEFRKLGTCEGDFYLIKILDKSIFLSSSDNSIKMKTVNFVEAYTAKFSHTSSS